MDTTKKQIITICGFPGSGKSTTAKALAADLDFTHFSSGDLFRSISREYGKNILQTNLEAERVDGISEIDSLVDQRLQDLGSSQDRMVIDSRTAWHWIPGSFKVFLDLDIITAAARIIGDMTPERLTSEHISPDPEEYATYLKKRLDSETRRYKKMYDIDPYNLENYDLVVDTKVNNVDSVIDIITTNYKEWSL